MAIGDLINGPKENLEWFRKQKTKELIDNEYKMLKREFVRRRKKEKKDEENQIEQRGESRKKIKEKERGRK